MDVPGNKLNIFTKQSINEKNNKKSCFWDRHIYLVEGRTQNEHKKIYQDLILSVEGPLIRIIECFTKSDKQKRYKLQHFDESIFIQRFECYCTHCQETALN